MVIVVANGDDENLKNAVISCNMWLIQPTLPVGIETHPEPEIAVCVAARPKRKRNPVGIETCHVVYRVRWSISSNEEEKHRTLCPVIVSMPRPIRKISLNYLQTNVCE